MTRPQTCALWGLRVFAVLSALVAISGGGTFLLNGVDGVPRLVGVEYPALVQQLESAAANIDADARATFDTWYRALGWYWIVTGLMLLWIVPRIHIHTAWFRFIHFGFMSVGIANALTIADTGTNQHSRYDAVAIELLVPGIAMIWQAYVAGAHRRATKAPS